MYSKRSISIECVGEQCNIALPHTLVREHKWPTQGVLGSVNLHVWACVPLASETDPLARLDVEAVANPIDHPRIVRELCLNRQVKRLAVHVPFFSQPPRDTCFCNGPLALPWVPYLNPTRLAPLYRL
jgi:hypothetical protein